MWHSKCYSNIFENYKRELKENYKKLISTLGSSLTKWLLVSHLARTQTWWPRTQNHKLVDIPPIFIPLLRTSDFANVAKLKDIIIDTSFIYNVLERWRSETHTFHFSTSECIIILEYVSMFWVYAWTIELW